MRRCSPAGPPIAIYRCPNKKFDAYSVYTNTVPSGALRGYGMTQPAFAVESAMHELAVKLDMDPLELRRRNIVRPGDALLAHRRPSRRRRVHRGRARRSASTSSTPLCGATTTGQALGDDWLVGTGTASSLHETAPPTEHISEAWATLGDDGIYEIAVGTVEFGEGTSTAHVQIAADATRHHAVADPPRAVRHRPHRLRHRRLRQRRACSSPATRCCGRRPPCATASWGSPPRTPGSTSRRCSMDDDGVRLRRHARCTLTELLEAARGRGIRFTEARKAYGSPRSVTSNTHGFRIAVHRVTGEIRILYSVQATDAGVVINPAQVRGQIEGGVAQGIGFALTENFHVDGNGVMINPNLRNYRIPTYADVPRTEVLLVDSTDSVGPMRAKGMAECCINPVAPALANALQDATGVRFRELPLTPERIYQPARREPTRCRDDLSRESRAMDTKKPTGIRRRRDGHHRPEGARRLRAGVRGLAAGHERRGLHYPGFLGAEINPPTAVQPDWVVVYRFDSVAHVQAWINSATRQERLAEGQQYFDGPGTQQVVGGGRQGDGSARDGRRDPPGGPGERRRVPGLAGATPPGGEQVRRVPRHGAVPAGRRRAGRVDGAVPLRERRRSRYLAGLGGAAGTARRGRASSPTSTSRTIDNSFGSWFAFDENGDEAPPPSETKTSIAVWVGLYPTVVLLTLALSPLKMPLWLGSADRKPDLQLRHELRDDAVLREPVAEALAAATTERAGGAKRTCRASRIVAGVTLFWVVVFYLVTTPVLDPAVTVAGDYRPASGAGPVTPGRTAGRPATSVTASSPGVGPAKTELADLGTAAVRRR